MGHVIAFVPASGGVGSTALACAVAVRGVAAGRSVVALDLDRVAGRLDVTLGVEQQPGWRWPSLCEVAGTVDGAALAEKLPTADGVHVLTGGSTVPGPGSRQGWLESVSDVVTGLRRVHDVTVLDVPRDLEVVDAVSGLIDALVVVAGARVTQLASASLTVAGLRAATGALPSAATGRGAWSSEPAPTWLVLRGDRVGPDLQDAVVDHLDLSLAGVLRDDPRMVDDVERGLPPGSRGRGPTVEVADDLLLRLVSLEAAA